MWWLALALAGDLEWRGELGGQLETEGNGIVTVGVRGEQWSAQLLTDTVDLRAWRQGAVGRVEAGLRGAAFAAGLWITPWTDGAPDPTRAHRVAYVGPDLAGQLWLGHGWYAEGGGFVQRHVFTPLEGTLFEQPDTWWLHGRGGMGGWFHDGAQRVSVRAGVDHTEQATAPFVRASGQWSHPGVVRPVLALEAVWADGADAVVATRVGGMTPYHVPLAGAAWAEFWAEDVLAVRGGVHLGAGVLTVPVVVDAVAWTEPNRPATRTALGLLSGISWRKDGWFVDAHAGYAPTLPRQPGIWPVPIYLLAGTEWRSTSRDETRL